MYYIIASRDSVRVALLTYTSQPNIRFNFDRYYSPEALLDAIETIEYDEGSGTNTAAALRATKHDIYKPGTGDRLHVRDIVIVVTDGQSVLESPIDAAQALHNDRKRTFAIGVGDPDVEAFQDELEGIASDPDSEHLFNVRYINDLGKIVESLVRRTCREAPPSEYHTCL